MRTQPSSASLELPRERRTRGGIAPASRHAPSGFSTASASPCSSRSPSAGPGRSARAEPRPPGTVTSGGTLAGGDVTARAHQRRRADDRVPHRRDAQRARRSHAQERARRRAESSKRPSNRRPNALTPDTLPPGGTLQVLAGRRTSHRSRRRRASGMCCSPSETRFGRSSNFNVITMLPFSAKKNGHIGLYLRRQLAERERKRRARRRRRRARTRIRPDSSRSRRRTPTRRSRSISSCAIFSRTISRTSGRSTSCCSRS